MFVDQYERSLDSKFRIVLPKRFREMLGDRVYLARSDSSLAVYSEEQFAETSQRLIDRDRAGELAPQVRLAFAASTVAVEPDQKTGRITIPPKLREYANLTNDVIVAGVLTHVEIWDKATFEALEGAHKDVVQQQFRAGGAIN